MALPNSPSFQRTATFKLSILNPEMVVRKGFVRFLQENISPKKFSTVLDYGAGESPYQGFFQCDRYLKCDVEQNSSKTISLFLKEPEFKIDVPDKSVDLVVSLDVLEHISRQTQTLEEIARVIKSGGTLLLKIPFIYREHELPNDYYRWTVAGIRHQLKAYGLETVKTCKIGNAWSTAFTLVYERLADEVEPPSVYSRILQKLLLYLVLPFINIFFTYSAERTYQSIAIIAEKK